MNKGMDCAVSTIGHAQGLKASGLSFICRYYPLGLGKSLSLKEAQELKAAGLYIVSVFECQAQDALGGAVRGNVDARKALAAALTCHQPGGSVIYFAVDFDATASQLPAILAYFQAVHQVLHDAGYLTGVYGSGRVCAAVKGAGWANKSWLAMSRGWAESKDYTDWDLAQTVGGVVCGISEDGDESKGSAGGWQPS